MTHPPERPPRKTDRRSFGWIIHTPENPPLECRHSLCPLTPLPRINLCRQHWRDELQRCVVKFEACRDASRKARLYHDAIQDLLSVAPPTPGAPLKHTFDEFLDFLFKGFISGEIDPLSLPENLSQLVPSPRLGRPPKPKITPRRQD